MADAEDRFKAFEVWAKYEDIAMHFNELISRLRFQALAGVAGLSASILVLADKLSADGTSRSVVAVAFFALALLWTALWILDFWYYNRLLLGAVEAIVALEESMHRPEKIAGLTFSKTVLSVVQASVWPIRLARMRPKFTAQNTLRSEENERRRRWSSSQTGPRFFYGIVLCVLLALSIGSAWLALRAGELERVFPPAASKPGAEGSQASQPPSVPPIASTTPGPAPPSEALPPPSEAGDAAGAAREWKELTGRSGVEWERLLDVGARVLEPFFERVSSAAATPLNLARMFLEQFAKSAGDESAKRVVNAVADFLLGLAKDAPASSGQARRPSEPPLVVLTSIVRFDLDSHDIPPSGQRSIRTLVARVGRRTAFWLVQGFTDRTGSERHNDRLATQRTSEVASYMRAHDVDGVRIIQRPRAELSAPEAGYDGSREPENRRAEVVVLVVK